MNKKITYFLILSSLTFSLSGCGQKEEVVEIAVPPVSVKAQTVAQSASVTYSLNYSGLVTSESEAKIIAKASGNAISANFKVGDKVSIGQELMRIDDINNHSSIGGGFNTSQIQQASMAVSQAQSSYELAKKNYENIILSGAKDLSAAEIAKNQAQSGQSNLNITTAEAIKSAELAYETAKTATENARLTLDNRSKQLKQGTSDNQENSRVSADSAVATCGSIISGVNGMTGVDDDTAISPAYSAQLGILDSTALNKTKENYRSAKQEYEKYQKTDFTVLSEKVASAIKLAELTKKLAEANKLLMDKTISSTYLSASALTTLQTTAGAYVNQANGALSQANGAKQSLENTSLNNDSTLDSLKKAYELAQKQEAQAAQALATVKAGNNSQSDQASFAAIAAKNNYENIKVKLNSQLVAAKTQMDLAALQYQNAQIALQSLYDSRQVISPIDGFVTKKAVSDGETVSVGQLLATVSQTENIKIQFYVDQEALAVVTVGAKADIEAGDKKITGLVTAISPQADALTKRFLVEVKPENVKLGDLSLGVVVSVRLDITKNTDKKGGEIILPLNAVIIGQTENYIYQVDNGKAKKVKIELGSVSGEFANIKTDLPNEAQIIIDGARLVSDGQAVEINK